MSGSVKFHTDILMISFRPALIHIYDSRNS